MKLTRRQIAIIKPSGLGVVDALVSPSGEWAIHRGDVAVWCVTLVRAGLAAAYGDCAYCRRVLAALENDGCGALIVATFEMPKVYRYQRAKEIVSQFRAKAGL